MNDVLQVHEITAWFGRRAARVRALDRVSLTVGPGEFVAIMGATGSGKSTLLNCAAGLEQTRGGRVELLGRDITSMGERSLSVLRRRHVGVVFQSFNLLSELTVAQNVMLPCRLGAPAARALDAVLADVGLDGLQRRRVGTLSGGQRQRVAIARTLVTRPSIVFADEPTGALDPDTGAQVTNLLRRTVDADGAAVAMVTHDPVVAAVSDRIVVLRNGRVVVDRPTPDAATIRALMANVSAIASASALAAAAI